MAFLFHRRLAIPLWLVALFTVALTAPPTATLSLIPPMTLFAIAGIGIAAIVVLVPAPIAWLRTSRAGALAVARGSRDPVSVVVSAGTGVRKRYEPNATGAADVLDLLRMDDDGGWQMPRPPARAPRTQEHFTSDQRSLSS